MPGKRGRPNARRARGGRGGRGGSANPARRRSRQNSKTDLGNMPIVDTQSDPVAAAQAGIPVPPPSNKEGEEIIGETKSDVEPVKEEPKVEESVKEEPKVEEPVKEEPKVEVTEENFEAFGFKNGPNVPEEASEVVEAKEENVEVKETDPQVVSEPESEPLEAAPAIEDQPPTEIAPQYAFYFDTNLDVPSKKLEEFNEVLKSSYELLMTAREERVAFMENLDKRVFIMEKPDNFGRPVLLIDGTEISTEKEDVQIAIARALQCLMEIGEHRRLDDVVQYSLVFIHPNTNLPSFNLVKTLHSKIPRTYRKGCKAQITVYPKATAKFFVALTKVFVSRKFAKKMHSISVKNREEQESYLSFTERALDGYFKD